MEQYKKDIERNNIMNTENLNPIIWGKYYWFVLHTIALTYPNNPNNTIKKRYYEFINTIPLLLPNENMANDFSDLLDKYPVSSYLDNRQDFVQWTFLIHNIINQKLGKPSLSLHDCINNYYDHYIIKKTWFEINKKSLLLFAFIFIIIIFSLLLNYFYFV